jgi:YHS domain-containing protein
MWLLAPRESVFCAVCFKRIPKSAAAMAETSDRVDYFCSLDCYEKWTREPQPSGRTPAGTPREATRQ